MGLGPLIIRTATRDDAWGISALVIRTLETSNAEHYTPEDIARTVSHFAPADVADRLGDKTTVVAVREETVVGTARLTPAADGKGFAVRTVFVCPDCHGQGIGRAMYDQLVRDIPVGVPLRVRSSLHGFGFYTRLGFRKVRDHWDGTEQTIEMVKDR